jgi:hypothetical protein
LMASSLSLILASLARRCGRALTILFSYLFAL